MFCIRPIEKPQTSKQSHSRSMMLQCEHEHPCSGMGLFWKCGSGVDGSGEERRQEGKPYKPLQSRFIYSKSSSALPLANPSTAFGLAQTLLECVRSLQTLYCVGLTVDTKAQLHHEHSAEIGIRPETRANLHFRVS